MGKWEEKKFKDFIKLNRGFDLPNDRMSNGIYPVIASTNIKGYHNKFKVKAPCVVTGRSGSLGAVQYVDSDSTPLNTTLYVKDFKKNNPKYVYYFLQTMHLETFNSGAGVPTLNQNHLHGIKVKVPTIPTQTRIADILSAYDDLIENNNRRIELLEKAAQELYKEWFVRFRFPNHENTKFVNGLPEGWEVKKLGEVVEIKGGKRLPAGVLFSEMKTSHPYIRIRDITTSKFVSLTQDFEYIDDATYKVIKKYTTNTGDILISIVGTIGAVCCVGKSLDGANLTENCVKLIDAKLVSKNYIYHFLNSESGKGSINSGVVGATQPKLPIYNISRIKLIIPDKCTCDLFTIKLENIDFHIMNLQQQNQNLKKQRDLLLPRLMSGRLEV